jgi:hypothetical protein
MGRPRQQSETQVAAPQQGEGKQMPDAAMFRLNSALGDASQCGFNGVQIAKSIQNGGATCAEGEEERVREMAADMLTGSLVATIAQRAPTAALPDDDAMMACLVSLANACIGSSAPTESELRAALGRCKERARATMQPSQALTAVRAHRTCFQVRVCDVRANFYPCCWGFMR